MQQLKEREPRIELSHYVDKEIQDVVRDKLKLPDFIIDNKNESKSNEDQQFDNNDEVDYSYAMKRHFERDSEKFDGKDFGGNLK